MWVFPLDGATLRYKAKKIDSNFTSLVLFKVKFREPRGYELMISPLYRGLKQLKKKTMTITAQTNTTLPVTVPQGDVCFLKFTF